MRKTRELRSGLCSACSFLAFAILLIVPPDASGGVFSLAVTSGLDDNQAVWSPLHVVDSFRRSADFPKPPRSVALGLRPGRRRQDPRCRSSPAGKRYSL